MSRMYNHQFQAGIDRYECQPNLSADPWEVAILHIARLFFMAFHVPERCSWVGAFRFADRAFGPTSGPAIAKATLESVSAVRAIRRSGFDYCDPTTQDCCELITPEERYFLTCLQEVRKNNKFPHSIAMMLCEGGDATSFFCAAPAPRRFG